MFIRSVLVQEWFISLLDDVHIILQCDKVHIAAPYRQCSDKDARYTRRMICITHASVQRWMLATLFTSKTVSSSR